MSNSSQQSGQTTSYKINNKHLSITHDAQVEGVIHSYEMAARMQGVAPELIDVSNESETTRKLYGMDQSATSEFGHRCLLAPLLVL